MIRSRTQAASREPVVVSGKKEVLACSLLALLLFPVPQISPQSSEVPWTHYVRIAAYGLRSDNADQIVRNAQRDGVFGIEVDNDIEGRYESFLDPEAKLKAIHEVAEKAH